MAAERKEQLEEPGAVVERWARSQPWREDVLAAAERLGSRVHIVGGAVRDLLLGLEPSDADLVVEGDAGRLATELDPGARVHERFGTARAEVAGSALDLASARSETYPEPGALPIVAFARIEADLDRRDFTVNAIAAPLDDPARLADPHGGLVDLAAKRLEILHEASFRDDPTRALRGARYAARLGFGLSRLASDRIADADLATVSADRVEAELAAMLAERVPIAALSTAREWGLLDADIDRSRRLAELADSAPWSGNVALMPAVLEAGEVRCGRAGWRLPERSHRLAGIHGGRPSELSRAARGAGISELAVATALGADWVPRYVADWRAVRPRITGSDLLAAGIERGPAIGAGLEAALAARLDGEAVTREEELETALAMARRAAP